MIERAFLEKEYVVNKLSMAQIGLLINKNKKTVSNYCKIYEIQARPFSTKGLTTRLGKKLSEESKDKIRQKAIGRKIPIEVRKKMGSKGNKNSGYIDGRTSINKRIRHSVEYKIWREQIFKRDNWTCQICSKRGGELHSDHIKQFAYYHELRFNLDNGRTLCVPCHRKTETFARKLKT